MFQYIKDFLSKRSICTRVNGVYSCFKSIDLGIPQGAILAPILFSILLHDLPKALSPNTHIVQYADDIAMWINTSLRKHTKQRVINYVQKIYQDELNKLCKYLKENGLELSGEKNLPYAF